MTLDASVKWLGYVHYKCFRLALTATVVKTLTLTPTTARRIIIQNLGAGDFYCTLDGKTPTVDGLGADTESQILVKASSSIELILRADEIKLISSATPTYQVIVYLA